MALPSNIYIHRALPSSPEHSVTPCTKATHLGKSHHLTAREDHVAIEFMLAVCYEADV
jgi:hypothetical protein